MRTSGNLALAPEPRHRTQAPGAAVMMMGVPRRTGALEAAVAREAWLGDYRSVLEREVARYARLGGDPDDLLGEALLAVVEARRSYNPAVHRTDRAHYVQNHVHRRVRAFYVAELRHHMRHVEPEAREAGQPDDRLDAVEAWWDLVRAWKRLSDRDRAALASERDVPGPAPSGAAAKKRLQRARQRLRRTLDGTAGAPTLVTVPKELGARRARTRKG